MMKEDLCLQKIRFCSCYSFEVNAEMCEGDIATTNISAVLSHLVQYYISTREATTSQTYMVQL